MVSIYGAQHQVTSFIHVQICNGIFHLTNGIHIHISPYSQSSRQMYPFSYLYCVYIQMSRSEVRYILMALF